MKIVHFSEIGDKYLKKISVNLVGKPKLKLCAIAVAINSVC